MAEPKIGELIDKPLTIAQSCKEYERTTEIFFSNNTDNWEVVIAFAQIKCSYDLPAPYLNDSGVFVLATNLAPGGVSRIDSCDIGGRNKPVVATWAECSFEMKHIPSGQTYQDLSTYPPTSNGQYYPRIGFLIEESTAIAAADGSEVEILRVRPILGKEVL